MPVALPVFRAQRHPRHRLLDVLFKRHVWKFWPVPIHEEITGTGGGEMSGTADPPLLVLSITGYGGGLMSGTSRGAFALHLTGSGGGEMGGAATVTSFLLLDQLLYPDVESDVPQINADEVTSQIPQEPG